MFLLYHGSWRTAALSEFRFPSSPRKPVLLIRTLNRKEKTRKHREELKICICLTLSVFRPECLDLLVLFFVQTLSVMLSEPFLGQMLSTLCQSLVIASTLYLLNCLHMARLVGLQMSWLVGQICVKLI